ncbi:hypothetical protein CMT41_18085 [Colwellia sp. MT41]|nr:hypothetical protein CMT41_18085 [Colwellia sp. MT41]
MVVLGLKFFVSSEIPLPIFAEKTKQNINNNYPSIAQFISPTLSEISSWQQNIEYGFKIDPLKWQGVGANATKISSRLVQNKISVSSVSQLINALKSVKPGQVIELQPGIYEIKKYKVNIYEAGIPSFPIRIIAKKLGEVVIKLKGEGFVVDQPYWQFENLYLIGNCHTNHSSCEHAFHVVGKGSNVVFKNNIFQDFNAAIKVNGLNGDYPDNGKVLGNTFYNTSARETANPVTPIDLMHANNWQVSSNFIFDFIKAGGNKVSYGAFFKGGSINGEFSRNLVMCNANLKSDSVAIGLSLGGGGSPDKWHRDNNAFEHANGIIRNNIIMHCANDVGIYINKGKNTLISHNILYNTVGIDVRFKESSVVFNQNILSGRVLGRDNGEFYMTNNLVMSRTWLTAAEPLNEIFQAPTNGNFIWIDKFKELISYESSNKHVDFCGYMVDANYLGAFFDEKFCLDKVNLTNPNRQFKYSDVDEK